MFHYNENIFFAFNCACERFLERFIPGTLERNCSSEMNASQTFSQNFGITFEMRIGKKIESVI